MKDEELREDVVFEENCWSFIDVYDDDCPEVLKMNEQFESLKFEEDFS